MRGLLFLLLIPIVAGAQTFGANYFVDAVNGNDSWAGTSPATAWKTLSKVQNSSFSPGDAILLMRGCVWRESLIPPSSGSSGSPITFGSYGSGAKPIINGSTVVTGWTLNTVAIYQVTTSYPAKVVVQDGTLLKYCPWNTDVATTFSGAPAGSFSADGTTCYVWSTDGASPNSHTTEVAQLTGGNDEGIAINSKSYVTIDGLVSCNNSGSGISYGENSSGEGIIIRNCTTFFNGNGGIYVSCSGTIRNCLVTLDTIYQNKMHGIAFLQHLTNSTISRNLVHDNSWDPSKHMIGIETWSASSTNHVDSCIIEYNEVYGTGSSMAYTGSECAGIQTDDYTAHTTVRYNKVYNNAGWGLYQYGGTGNTYYYNVVYQNALGGFYGGGTVSSPTMSLYNNTFFGNGGYGTSFGVIFTTGHGVATMKNCIIAQTATYEFYDYVAGHSTPDTIDNNLYYHPAGGQFLWWDAGSEIGYTSLSAYRSASGQDAHSLNVNPLFTNSSTHDFTLQSSSPCINAGTNLGYTRDNAGIVLVGAPDVGAYEYAGIASTPSFPSGSFTASPDTLVKGGVVTLTWTDSNATSASINPGVGSVYIRGGEMSVMVESSVTFVLKLTNGTGSSNYKVPIMVLSPLAGMASNPVPLGYSLHQNYPNPFNPSTTITYEVPSATHVTITVYDMLGRKVSVLVNDRRETGAYQIRFDGSNLASGVYFYQLQAGDYVATKKLVLMK